MNKISIYLNVGAHPIYRSLIFHPPENVKFVNKPSFSSEKLIIYSKKINFIRKTTNKISYFLRLPRMFYFRTNADLIHTSRGIIPLNKRPWVMDIEHAKSFFDDHRPLLSERAKKIVRKFLLSEYCKKIIPHCYMAEKSLVSAFGEDLKEKIEVVYPAIEPSKFKAKQSVSKVRLLFIANKFFEKGGKEVFEAFQNLSKKYDIELWVKCKIPKNFKNEMKKFKNIKIIEKNLGYQELFKEIYSKCQIILFPSYIDTFGFSSLEAMSVGLPIVATNIFAIPEIVEDEKNGFLVEAKKYDWSNENGLMKKEFLLYPEKRTRMYKLNKPEIVKQLIEKLSLLIENSSLRRKMGRYGRWLVERGRFSIAERNKKLRAIYEEALGTRYS